MSHGATLVGHRLTGDSQSMTAAGFARLLQRLDSDADRAAIEYEQLRLTLVKFFDWRGAREPEQCADETLDRLVEKLQREVSVEDVRRYAHGIARLVLLERLRRQAQFPIEELPNASDLPAASSRDPSELGECFHRCLAKPAAPEPDPGAAVLRAGRESRASRASCSHSSTKVAGRPIRSSPFPMCTR
jgi:DNA-directed RNA polymerase specialized sigma24 family protein